MFEIKQQLAVYIFVVVNVVVIFDIFFLCVCLDVPSNPLPTTLNDNFTGRNPTVSPKIKPITNQNDTT
jgi:hypothetical protein